MNIAKIVLDLLNFCRLELNADKRLCGLLKIKHLNISVFIIYDQLKQLYYSPGMKILFVRLLLII